MIIECLRKSIQHKESIWSGNLLVNGLTNQSDFSEIIQSTISICFLKHWREQKMNDRQLGLFGDNTTYVLMSLQEKYYNEIKAGRKRYEFRKQYCKNGTTAFIYVSKSVKAIKGIITFGEPIYGTSEEISRISEKINPNSYESMMEYLNKGKGYAIPIIDMCEIKEVTLEKLRTKFKNFVVPQSYYLLNKKPELLDFLLSQEITERHIFEKKE